ncbi:MAG TPA: DUF427 domain-containing protein [Bradyrhizobium sp.]|nr:DUF427 domain-containing protein [Bradyrhizobium sp.]
MEAIAQQKPKKEIIFEPTGRRIRIEFNGTIIADSSRAMLLLETGHLPVYYLPLDDIRLDLMPKTEHTTHCPYKGDARYRSIAVGDRTAENAVWYYLEPLPGAPDLRHYAAFYWDKMDRWFEEDEEIFRHPRSPHKRVDAIRSSRRVQVVLDGTIVVDTTKAVFVFETGLPTRYYLPAEDVKAVTLIPTDTHTVCPYKGTASYYAVALNGRTYPDLVWYYPDPVPEITKIAGLVSFYNEKVDKILVDGDVVPKVRTAWS